MKRFHVHLNVAAAPDKLRDDYAQWMLDDLAVNFAVSTQKCCDGDGGGVSHLGFQVEDDAGLAEITRALTDAEQAIFEEQENRYCYAKGNKTWASDPYGVVWETFHRLGHSETMGRDEARDSQIEDLHERVVI